MIILIILNVSIESYTVSLRYFISVFGEFGALQEARSSYSPYDSSLDAGGTLGHDEP